MSQIKGTHQKDTDLRATIKRAWEEWEDPPKVDEREKADTAERERKFHAELWQLLEKKWGKSFVADWRTFIVDGIKYQLSAAKVYVDLEGEDAFVRREQIYALKNKKSTITDKEREDVTQLNRQLESAYPKKTPRYTEIARQLDMRPGRVRYIIEGVGDKK